MKDPRVDAVIAKAAPFARPILKRFRRAVHAACPDVKETIKWGMPSFERNGILAGMAPFKAHCAVWFRRQAFKRIESDAQLPGDSELKRLVLEAVALDERTGGKLPRAKSAPKTLRVPPTLAAALKGDAKAAKGWETLTPGKKRDYAEWIADAKRDETREKRLKTALPWIARGKSLHWKYENC